MLLTIQKLFSNWRRCFDPRKNKAAGTPNATKLFFNISLDTPTGAQFNATSAVILYSTDNGITWFKVKKLTILPGLVTARGVGIPHTRH